MESVINRYMPDLRVISYGGGEHVISQLDMMSSGTGKRIHIPGLILLDLKMPVRDGCEMFGILRNNKITSVVPVVIFSSSGIEKDIRNCYNLGVNAFVSKPVAFDEFEKVLHTILDFWMKTCEVTEDHA